MNAIKYLQKILGVTSLSGFHCFAYINLEIHFSILKNIWFMEIITEENMA